LIASPEAAQRELNWRAQISFEAGLVKTIEAYRQQLGSV
jgi:nucleoside-diphosphate-sugar epimerase